MGLVENQIITIGLKNNIKHYEKLGYEIPKRKDKAGRITTPIGSKIDVRAEDLQENSSAKVRVRCDNCNLESITKYSGYSRCINKNEDKKYYCKSCSKKGSNKFKLSDDKTYWIGETQKGEEFWFNGNDEIVKYIKSCVWQKTTYGYFQNGKGERLNRIVMSVTDNKLYVNFKNDDRYDNRVENLEISSTNNYVNSRIRNKWGYTGLIKRKDNWLGVVYVEGLRISTKTNKSKQEAILDLLIIQKYFEINQNKEHQYLLDEIDSKYKKEVEEYARRQFEKAIKANKNVVCKNKFELSEDETFYWMYDSKNNKCKISIEDLEIVKQGNWHQGMNGKPYFKGRIVYNNKIKLLSLHRFLFGLIDIKYKNWYIDHLDGNGLNNMRTNLKITNAKGNGLNRKESKCYQKTKSGKYEIYMVLHNDEAFYKLVDTENEAIKLVKQQKELIMKNRLCFDSKTELDNYLK